MMIEVVKDSFSTKHPHEPGIPPAYDEKGRCLVCVLLVNIRTLEAENERLSEEVNDCHKEIEMLRQELKIRDRANMDALLKGVEDENTPDRTHGESQSTKGLDKRSPDKRQPH